MKNFNEIVEEIKRIGLFVDNRGSLYGHKYDSYIRTDGGLWQKPEELATLLSNLKNVSTFLNIGTFNGVTFNFISDYLNSIQPTACIAIDPVDQAENNKKPEYSYIITTSDSFINEKFDFVFIDGDHSYKAVKKDWQNVGQFANIIAFHDIDDRGCPGVTQFWKELKRTVQDDFEIIEAIEKTEVENSMGMGILIRKNQ